MLQWFIRFHEFAEFSGSSAIFRKNSNVAGSFASVYLLDLEWFILDLAFLWTSSISNMCRIIDQETHDFTTLWRDNNAVSKGIAILVVSS